MPQTTTPPRKRRRTTRVRPSGPAGEMAAEKITTDNGAVEFEKVIFIECFAGKGVLAKALERVGVRAVTEDLDVGGVDFANDQEVTQLWARWAEWSEAGWQLLFHFAPPCSSFSAVRDRNRRTRLRSPACPQGLDTTERITAEGNKIVRNTALSIRFLVLQLNAAGSMEQPTRSYMLPFLEAEGLLDEHEEVIVHQCRFGRSYKKPTSFLCFGGLVLKSIGRQCVRMSCGRPFHTRLGFDGSSTSAAAEYPPGLAAAYAGAIVAWLTQQSSESTAIDRLVVTSEGVLQRHIDRGPTLNLPSS